MTFQLWSYRVSHGEMLIRRPKGAEHARNADIMFAGVEYVELPHELPELAIDVATDEEVARVGARLGKSVDARNVFALTSQGRRFFVVAAVMKSVESDMDIFNSPFEG